MPRGAASNTAGGLPLRRKNGKKSSSTSKTKIVIRPYQKPPTLPPNYYETTVNELLEGFRAVLNERLSSKSSTTSSSSSSNLSLQTAYQSVANLVSHQYGERLYADLLQAMRQAAAACLVRDGNTNNNILSHVVTQYAVFTEYLLLLKHICLALDSAYQYDWDEKRAVAITSSNSTTTGTSQQSQQRTKMTLWQVGLHLFLQRLRDELQLMDRLYETWKSAFLQDWNNNNNNSNTSNIMMYGGGSSSDTATNRQQGDLQNVWYMWQDLRVLPTLPIQTDLETYWRGVSDEWKSNSENYNVTGFLQFAYTKHLQCTQWRPWLPLHWLWMILDEHLVQPHLNTEYLLKDEYLFPVLTQHVFRKQQAQAQTTTQMSLLLPASPIQQLWNLACRQNQQKAVAAAIQRFAKAQGLQRVVRKSTAVPDLLELQEALNSMIASLLATNNNDGSTNSSEHNNTTNASSNTNTIINLKSVWEEVVNYDTTPSLAEQLAKFLDSILRSNKKMDLYQSSSPDDWLQRIIAGLFVPISAKDIFEGFYKRDLAKRLLWNRVVSMDIEKQVCSLLKAECGAGYTSKMEGMFQDVEWSRETMLVYKQSTTGNSPAGKGSNNDNIIDTEVQVLTTGYWPVYPQYPNLTLPDGLKIPQDQFANHYKNKYQGRRMTWQYALGHCVVRCNGWNKPYELLVSLCQALALIQFETAETVRTLPQLLAMTGLEDRGEMERILQSLALGKDGTRILRKMDYDVEPGKKKKTRMSVDDRDTFVINRAFESNSRRIRITNIMMKETREERQKTVEAVSRDRLYLIDAVLVRIMKARKTILHQALIPQVLEQVKVPAQTSDVKKRIESLIEREYMERDAKDRNRYNYLA